MTASAKTLFLLGLVLTLLVSSGACTRDGRGVDAPKTSVYYWRTVWQLDSAERQFLADNKVERVYLRMFDVVMRNGAPMPNATVRFAGPVPEGVEIVPTVFITENCLRHRLDTLAGVLVKRILQIGETNDLPAFHEIQIDCDWTARSQEAYYSFLKEVGAHLGAAGVKLSVTIRLHQLAMTPPPADYGVLMVYNTGDYRHLTDRNPILDYRDVHPYLKRLAGYDLPLCAAYPAYEWQLLYRDGEFKAILRDEDLADTARYRNLGNNIYMARTTRDIPMMNDDGTETTWIAVGDTIVSWLPAAPDIIRVMNALEKERPSINRQTILYSLQSKYLNLYTPTDYETLLRP